MKDLSPPYPEAVPEIDPRRLHPYAGSAAARQEQGWGRRHLLAIILGVASALVIAGLILFW